MMPLCCFFQYGSSLSFCSSDWQVDQFGEIEHEAERSRSGQVEYAVLWMNSGVLICVWLTALGSLKAFCRRR